jgi:hypothetical protein
VTEEEMKRRLYARGLARGIIERDGDLFMASMTLAGRNTNGDRQQLAMVLALAAQFLADTSDGWQDHTAEECQACPMRVECGHAHPGLASVPSEVALFGKNVRIARD